LADESAELQALHIDLGLTGLDTKEIEELLAPRADEQTPRVRLGDASGASQRAG
jgi:hypothetical protein